MKQAFLIVFVILIAGSAFSQTYRGQWLVGGSGSFSSKSTPNSSYSEYKQTEVTIQPNGGYFIINNLAAGVRFSYDYIKSTSPGIDSIFDDYGSTALAVAPFVRYYVLPAGKKINVLADASYGWGQNTFRFFGNKSKQKLHGYEFAAGPVWFVSPNVALELLADYRHNNLEFLNSDFSVNIGFEIHLGRQPKARKG